MAGHAVRRFLLSNAVGLRVTLMSYGATVLAVEMAAPSGGNIQVNRGLPTPQDYANNPAYMGVTCGRFAGRIAHGVFNLEGERVELQQNSAEHHLHGGVQGFNHKHWGSKVINQTGRVGVEFSYLSQHGEEGYPGRLQSSVTYTLDDDSNVGISYLASALDCPTIVNLTNHTYWNLSAQASIHEHELTLAAHSVLEFDENTLPTGTKNAVAGTAFDFRRPSKVGERMELLDPQAMGFDHCFVDLDRESSNEGVAHQQVRPVAHLRDPISGREMRVATDQPAVVLYTGNYLDGSAAMGGHNQHAGLCLECQQFSDAPNHAHFPSTVVRPGQSYTQTTIYQFFQN